MLSVPVELFCCIFFFSRKKPHDCRYCQMPSTLLFFAGTITTSGRNHVFLFDRKSACSWNTSVMQQQMQQKAIKKKKTLCFSETPLDGDALHLAHARKKRGGGIGKYGPLGNEIIQRRTLHFLFSNHLGNLVVDIFFFFIFKMAVHEWFRFFYLWTFDPVDAINIKKTGSGGNAPSEKKKM